MSAVNFSVRSSGGTVSYGKTSPENGNFIPFYSGAQISLNLAPQDVAAYKVDGENLVVELTNGQTVTLQGYFYDADRDPELFLSSHGNIHHVDLGGQVGDQYLASYAEIDTSGKYSAYDQLVFLDLERVEPVVAPLAAPLLGGLGGVAAAGAAVVGGGIVVDRVTGGGGGGVVRPTVDNPDVTVETGGPTPPSISITGTGEPGASVSVIVGGIERTTTVVEGGTWSVTYLPTDLPGDGVYTSVVTVVNEGGDTFVLDGPSVDVDFTPPNVVVNEGTVSIGDIVNAAEHRAGHVIGGSGEAGAQITVEINGHSQGTVVGQDGTWSINLARGVLAEGEYTIDARITAVDDRGNTTIVNESVQVDTVSPAINMQTIEGDNIINAAEAADGVTLNGAGEPGATLTVEFQGYTTNTVVGADGNWSLYFSPGQIASGTYDSAVRLTATDAAGNSTVSDYTLHVDTEGNVTLNTPIAGDDQLNEAEALQGLTLTGTADAGSSVDVTFEGVTRTVRAGTDGSWSAIFLPGEIRSGEYVSVVEATSTDSVGNTSTVRSLMRVDTTTNVTMQTPVAGDDIVNAAEANAGVTLNGTAEVGSTVVVELAGSTKTVQAGLNGRWSATFTNSDIPAGTYNTTATVTSTDHAGNTATSTSNVQVDTEIGIVMDAPQAGGDDIVTQAEVAAGLDITGTGEAGAQVSVVMDGVTKTTTVDASGRWSVTYGTGDIREAEFDTTVVATITDAAGNTTTASHDLTVDTKAAATIAVNDVTIGGDDFVNASEMNNGLLLNGTADPGATATVVVEGVSRTATADNNGNWSVTYEPGSLPRGEYNTTATVTTTDDVGNTATSSVDFRVDTEVANPIIESVTFADDAVSAVTVQEESSTFSISTLNTDGSSSNVSAQSIDLGNETMLNFNPNVPDGTHLVISSRDQAGNDSATMVVLDDNATTATTLGHASAGNFQIEAIELDYAANADLTLTESQIRDLANGSDTLTVHGGSDDRVTLRGATRTGSSQSIDGEAYDVYTIGDDGVTVVIDQDINVII